MRFLSQIKPLRSQQWLSVGLIFSTLFLALPTDLFAQRTAVSNPIVDNTPSTISNLANNAPNLFYSSYFGGDSDETSTAIAVDDDGNIYITGYTYSDDLLGKTNNRARGQDIFVTKLDPTGKNALYTTYIGGSESEEAKAITVDDQGKVWVTGETTSDDFPLVQPIQSTRTSTSYEEGFVAQLDSQGTLIFSSYLGGDTHGSSVGNRVVLDSNGNVYLAGKLGNDFVVKLAAQTHQVLYRRQFIFDQFFPLVANDLALDGEGNIYVTGEIDRIGLPVKNPIQAACASIEQNKCSPDAYVLKLDQNGTVLFGTYFGGSTANGAGSDVGKGIAVDSEGNIYLTGETTTSDFPTKNAFQNTKMGEYNFSDLFVAKFARQGESYALAYSSYLGGKRSEQAGRIALDANNHAFIIAQTDSPDLRLVNPLQNELGRGICDVGGSERYCIDALVAEFAPDGTVPFISYWGGIFDDIGADVAIGKTGKLYATGRTKSYDFPTTGNAIQKADQPQMDAFVLMLGQPLPPTPGVVVNGDFESDVSGNWREHSSNFGGAGSLILSGEQLSGLVPHSGAYAVWMGGAANETSDLSQSLMITSNTPELRFYYQIDSDDSCGKDQMQVLAGSSVLKTVELCQSQNSATWTEMKVDLSAFIGKTIDLHFHTVCNETQNSNLFLDDITLAAQSTPPGQPNAFQVLLPIAQK